METTIKTLQMNFEQFTDQTVLLQGWVRNNRAQKEFGFIDLSDGSSFTTVQIVYEEGHIAQFRDIQKYRAGSAIEVTGIVTPSLGTKQPFEIKAESIRLLGDSPETYPIQPKRHSREFLRENLHLRVRTNLFQAIFRVRSVVSYAIHRFFQERGFVYVHTPIITGSDAEGAGEMFRVTTMDAERFYKSEGEAIDFSRDFFGKPTNLTVSGQLQAEAYALAFRNVYTFGPTFRAENSNTLRHASEFWMIEPEFAFADLSKDMEIAEAMVKFIIDVVLTECPQEIDFFDQFVEKGLKEKLTKVFHSKFHIATHKDAITILRNAKTAFENEPQFGEDLATEHEKYLTKHFNGPVFVIDWPKDIKAFYMRMNDDHQTVAAMD
ncbi:MAG: asparagine--tRNA ligase, partial [Candidatus Izemoplasmatales bacterium]